MLYVGGKTLNPAITTRRLFNMKHGKKYVEASKLYDKQTQYDRDEAVAIVKKLATAKFDDHYG